MFVDCNSTYKSKIERLEKCLEEIFLISNEFEIKNPLNKDKWIEMILSSKLNKNCSKVSRGYDAEGGVEFKTCEEGGTIQFHWLSKNKVEELKGMKELYCAIKISFNQMK